MDREKVIQQIATAMATLEKCSDEDIESAKRFLRWMPDEALQDILGKHMKALENLVHAQKE